MESAPMTFTKHGLKEALLKLEDLSIARADAALRGHFQATRLHLDETRDDQDQSQQRQEAVLAMASESRVHEHEAHRRLIEAATFEPKRRAEPGAIVKTEGRYLLIAVPTPSFVFHGATIVGVSPESPIARAMAGLAVGDHFHFRGRDLNIQEVY
jgi:hypothetical protein